MNNITLQGILFDEKSSFQRGPAKAPPLIREALYSNSANMYTEDLKDVSKMSIEDKGDFEIEEYFNIEAITSRNLAGDGKLLTLGGDHSITYPLIKAHHAMYPVLDILHIGISDEEQSHIFLVPVIAAWLLWLRKSRFRRVRFQPSLIGPGLVAAGTAMSWSGFNSGTQIAWHAGVGVVFVGVVVSMTGMEPLRQFAPVFGVLAFALPVPGIVRETLAIPLQSLATVVTQSTLELVGVASTRLGNVLTVTTRQSEQIRLPIRCPV